MGKIEDMLLAAVQQHALWTAGTLLAFYFMFPHLMKKSLTNGGGAILRTHIKAENSEQSEHMHGVVTQALERHERDEFRRYDDMMTRLEEIEKRVWELAQDPA